MALYTDQDGRPRLRESITAFVDVLGFSPHTVAAAAKAGVSQQCLDDIAKALADSRTFVRESLAGHALGDAGRWALKFFSDNLLFGYPCDGDASPAAVAAFVLQCVQRYQLQMTLSGFFVRGALSFGPLCITDDIIFGTALLESYQLESKASIVPRIILTDSIYKLVAEHFRVSNPSPAREVSDFICHDIDGWWFVNYLQAAVGPQGVNWRQVDQHKAAVMNSLARSARHDILPKFGWVSRYHNVFCHWYRDAAGYSDDYRIKRVDEESAIQRLSDVPTS